MNQFLVNQVISLAPWIHSVNLKVNPDQLVSSEHLISQGCKEFRHVMHTVHLSGFNPVAIFKERREIDEGLPAIKPPSPIPPSVTCSLVDIVPTLKIKITLSYDIASGSYLYITSCFKIDKSQVVYKYSNVIL